MPIRDESPGGCVTLARQTVHQRYTEEVFMTMTGSFLRHLLASGGVRYLKKSAWFSSLIVNLLFVALSKEPEKKRKKK